jgi:hypothetical protein
VIKFLSLFLLFVTGFASGISNYFYTNPASLTIDSNYVYRIRYLNADLKFANNTLDLAQIYNNFIKDVEWDSIQKANLLNSIPESGFTAAVDTIVKPIELSTRIFSVSMQYRGIVTAQALKDLFDLVLFGNDLNRLYDISHFEFSRLEYFDFALGMCYPLIRPPDESNALNYRLLQQLNIGGRFHWLKGKFITQTDSSSGSVATTPEVIVGQVKLFQTTAHGGNNFAFDLGAIAKFNNPITFGIALLNLNTSFIWNKDPSYRIIDASIESLSMEHYIETGSFDSLYTKKDTTFSIASFKTSLPAQISVQVSYQPFNLLAISTSFQYYLSECQFICDFHQSCNLDIYLNLSKFFTTGVRFTTNLKKDYIIGNYFHFIRKGTSLNLSIEQKNGFIKSAKGLGLKLYLDQNL